MTRLSQMRSAELDRAWRIGRNARIRGLDVKAANVELARQIGWQARNDFDDVLLDECERGWQHEDELRAESAETVPSTTDILDADVRLDEN